MELTAAEPRRKGLVQLYLDGQPGPKIDEEVFALSRLKAGEELDLEELEALVERSDARRAREKALYLLEHRSHSKRELTADHLEEIGLIDDRAYAESYARELVVRKRYGLRRVRQELSRKGISPEIQEEVLCAYEDGGEAARENIALVLQRRYPLWREDEKSRRRAVAALQRLGYSYSQISAVMGQPEEWE